MAVVIGTNAGFVTSAPSADPEVIATVFDGQARMWLFTSPAGDNNQITSMGAYISTADAGGDDRDLYFLVYEDNGSQTAPGNLAFSTTITRGAGIGWKTVSGLEWAITASTNYWLGVAMASHAGSTAVDQDSAGSQKVRAETSWTTPSDPWGGASTGDDSNTGAVYAIYAEAAAGGGGGTEIPAIGLQTEVIRVGGEYVKTDLENPTERKYG